MKKKRLLAAMTAAACVASTFAVMPQAIGTAGASEIVYNGFEVTYDGWHGTDTDVEFAAEEGAGFGGSRGMVVSERSTADQGAASSKGLYLWGGVKYNYSVKVFAEKDDVFHINLRTVDMETGEEEIVSLVDKAVKGGEWTDLSASYKASKNAAEFEVIITTDSTEDFAFDDFTVEGSTSLTAQAAEQGLKDEFANYFRVGNILNGTTVNNNAIKGIILKDHNAVECENETKPDATIVQNGSSDTNVKVSLNRCAAICDFAAQNGLGFRGHTLVWHSQTPEWFFKSNFSDNGNYVDKSTMDKRMESYIKNMFAAYATQYPTLNLFAYDVCNEVINDGTANQGGLRPTNGTNGQNGSSAWVRVYGDNSFVEKAFTYARQYAPAGCKLYYNDYNEFANDKQNCIINTIIKPLKAKGLIDGMGMQSHLNCAASNAWGDTNSYLAAMDKYLSLGIDVQVTELDLVTEGGRYSLQDQATKYKAIFQHCVDVNTSGRYEGKVTLVQVWGPNDNNSWVATDNQSGRSNSPLLYDGNNQPKSAYSAITSIIPQPWGDGSQYSGGGDTPTVTLPDENGNYFHSTFESSEDGWSGRAATVETSGSQHFEGSKSLFVSGRESAWNGTQHALSSMYFKPGEEYSFSVNVMHTSPDDTVHYMMKIQYSLNDEAQYDEVASGDAPAGQWLQLSNPNYKIPAGATDVQIYVETEDSLNDFYIDDMYASVAGTTHTGAGQPRVKKVTPGDLNFDGVCDAFDMPLARKYVVNADFTDDMMKKAADVDKSGKYEVNDLVLIDEFLLGKIDTFPTVVPPVDFSSLEQNFNGVTIAESFKKETENNPIYTQRFGADPGWLVYDGRLYVYTTADEFAYQNNQMIENDYSSGYINCLSTADLVNWTDHGQIPVAKTRVNGTPIAKWANNAWAPDAAWKKIDGQDKFFLYFANNGSGIGVITADDPAFTKNVRDPLGRELISRNTPNSNVTWLFDPGVYYDPDTDTGIIAYGGGVPEGQAANTKQGRIAKLGADMTSIVGTPIDPGTPYLFEDSSMIKIGDTWYYSFCHNWNVPGGASVNGQSFSNADIGYMTSKDPLKDYTYQGVVFKNTGTQRLDNGGNNHHSIVEFKGSYYVLYHSRQLEMRMGVNGGKGLNYRSPCIDKATISNGKITCNGSQNGVSQIEKLNVYETVQAETMSNQSKNISVKGVGNTTVALKKGEWIKVSGADLSKGVESITGKGKGTGVIKICAGSVTGTVIGYIDLNGSGDEVTLPAKESVTGSKDLYLIASGDVELDYWYFS